MSKFVKGLDPTVRSTKTKNLAGGVSYELSPEIALATATVSSFVETQFYRSADAQISNLAELIANVDPKFAAKVALYGRHVGGMRSTSHVIAGELASRVKGQEWFKFFIRDVIYRPDDAVEILSYILSQHGEIRKGAKRKGYRPVPNSVKKGIALALVTDTPYRKAFDAYQIKKYARTNSALNLLDVARLTHPKVEAGHPIDQLFNKGSVDAEETWEVAKTKLGQTQFDTQEAKEQAVQELWADKLPKLGYLAMIRNIRKISEEAPELLPALADRIRNKEHVRRSKVFPFQIYLPYMVITQGYKSKRNVIPTGMRDVLMALGEALDVSLSNAPKFRNLVICVDVSGSMAHYRMRADTSSGVRIPRQLAAWDGLSLADVSMLFAAAIAKVNPTCRVVFFDSYAREYLVDPYLTTLHLNREMMGHVTGGYTSVESAFDFVSLISEQQKVENVLLLSDTQTDLQDNR